MSERKKNKNKDEYVLAKCAGCGKEVILKEEVVEQRKKVYCTIGCLDRKATE